MSKHREPRHNHIDKETYFSFCCLSLWLVTNKYKFWLLLNYYVVEQKQKKKLHTKETSPHEQLGTVPCTGVCDGCTRQPRAVRSSPAGLVMRRIFDELVLHELLHEVVGGSASVSESRFSSTASRASVSDRQIGSSPRRGQLQQPDCIVQPLDRVGARQADARKLSQLLR